MSCKIVTFTATLHQYQIHWFVQSNVSIYMKLADFFDEHKVISVSHVYCNIYLHAFGLNLIYFWVMHCGWLLIYTHWQGKNSLKIIDWQFSTFFLSCNLLSIHVGYL